MDASGSRQQRVLRPAAVQRRRSLVRHRRRAGRRKESYDTFFSPKLSAGGFLLPFATGAVSSVKVFGNIGKGIKSPTFSERFGGSFADPNPDLRVEQARTADIGVEATFADQRLRGAITYFDNATRTRSRSAPGSRGDGIPEFINIDGSKARRLGARGRRCSGRRRFTAWQLLAVDTEVVTNHQHQPAVPAGPAAAAPAEAFRRCAPLHRANRLTVHFDARFVGDRHDNSFLSLRTVPNAERPRRSRPTSRSTPATPCGLASTSRAHEALTVFLRGTTSATGVRQRARLSRLAARGRGRRAFQRARSVGFVDLIRARLHAA